VADKASLVGSYGLIAANKGGPLFTETARRARIVDSSHHFIAVPRLESAAYLILPSIVPPKFAGRVYLDVSPLFVSIDVIANLLSAIGSIPSASPFASNQSTTVTVPVVSS